ARSGSRRRLARRTGSGAALRHFAAALFLDFGLPHAFLHDELSAVSLSPRHCSNRPPPISTPGQSFSASALQALQSVVNFLLTSSLQAWDSSSVLPARQARIRP